MIFKVVLFYNISSKLLKEGDFNMKCRKCEYELEKDWKYCPKCKAKRTSYALIILSIVVSVLVAYSLVAEIIFLVFMNTFPYVEE